MAVLFQIRNAYKSYGDQVLLDNAEATITDDVKVGFVGRNGAGKSTLLRILLGEEELDAGEVIRHPRLRVGYLRQHDPFEPGESTLDFLMRDSGQPDWKCGEVAAQFEIKGEFLNGLVKSLSGGWQTRVKLAALLLHEPNLLLLDEPTNFLDLRTQILLEHFLKSFREACLIVSHDRTFLSATCEHTLDLTRGKLTTYPGKIEPFLECQEQRREQAIRENETTMAKARQLERFIAKNKAGANTASQARSKQKQLDRLQFNEIAAAEKTAYIQAPLVSPRQGTAVRCHDLAIGYPDHEVAKGIQIEIEHQQRAAIVGDNGQGKTTLLRTLVGSLAARSGQVRWGHGIEIGVYAQHVYTTLPASETVLEYLEYKAIPGTTDQQVLAVAGSMLFRDHHVKKKISVLSGGERARLCMAGLLLGNYNVLVLDEPGNHLDVETVEALAEALLKYKGTVIFTSHDRHFMKRIASSIIEVRDGCARNYLGDYEAYVYAINKEIDEGEREYLAARSRTATPAKSVSSNRKSMMLDERAIQKQLKLVERKITKLDGEKKELQRQLLQETDPQRALDLHEKIESISSELQEAERQWLELNEGN
jgi:ATP-binding cassette, subfamily F, member 3